MKLGIAKPKPSAMAKKNVFGDADSSSSDSEVDNKGKLKSGSIFSKQTDDQIKKAEEALGDVINYDDFISERNEKEEKRLAAKGKTAQSSKYVATMKKAADDRKLMAEIRKEKHAEKERDQEAADGLKLPTESYTTDAWKEELKKINMYRDDQDKKDRADVAKMKTRDFSKGLLEFRQNIMARAEDLEDDEVQEVKENEEEMQEDFYASLNKGISKSSVRRTPRMVAQAQTSAAQVKKEVINVKEEPTDMAVDEKVDLSKDVKPKIEGVKKEEGDVKIEPKDEDDEDASGFVDAPSAALLASMSKPKETKREKQERLWKRHARRNDSAAIQDAKARFRARQEAQI
eukprot:TRINITY_DN51603_c0_g1_i1.p1 TRINITY_DN51603_c0_g1~~TRINITY_DN51603_c0_g1_i1.p1  ORF type:complete len:345 (-),score=73.02 TRINITY_DN51603_c0_g1_i1:231-1265(-)